MNGYKHVVYVHSGVLFSNKEEQMLFAGKWIEPQIIKLNEINQT
jgi:hypothetical protein